MNGEGEFSKGPSPDDRDRIRYPLPEILDSYDMSEIFGVSRQTLSRWREKGLPYIRIGIKYYYIEASVLDWLKTLETRET